VTWFTERGYGKAHSALMIIVTRERRWIRWNDSKAHREYWPVVWASGFCLSPRCVSSA